MPFTLIPNVLSVCYAYSSSIKTGKVYLGVRPTNKITMEGSVYVYAVYNDKGEFIRYEEKVTNGGSQ